MTMMHEAPQSRNQEDAVTLFFMEVERIQRSDPWISQLGAGILAGVTLDIAHSSRAFARALGVEHALVLREIQALTDLGRIIVTNRNSRTQGCTYALIPLPAATLADGEPERRPPSLESGPIIASTGGAVRGCSSKRNRCPSTPRAG